MSPGPEILKATSLLPQWMPPGGEALGQLSLELPGRARSWQEGRRVGVRGRELTPDESLRGQSALSILWVLWMAWQSETLDRDSRAAQYCRGQNAACQALLGTPSAFRGGGGLRPAGGGSGR